MNSSDRQSRLYRIGRWVLLGTLVAILVGAALYFWIGPNLADSRIRHRLAGITKDTGLTVDYDQLAAQGLGSLTLDGLRVGFKGAGEPTFRAERVTVDLRWWPLLSGRPEISEIDVSGAHGRIHVGPPPHATNLHALFAVLRSRGGSPASDSGSREPDDGAQLSAPLGRFGGAWPDVTVQGGSLDIQLPGAPFDRISRADLTVESRGELADVRAHFKLAGSKPDSGWVVPDTVDVEATLDRHLGHSTGAVTFSPTLEVVGLPPYDFLRTGLDSLRLEAEQAITVVGARIGLQDDGPPTWIGRTDEATLQFVEWPRRPSEAEIQRVELASPSLRLTIGPQGESALSDLWHLVATPAARQVRTRARAIAATVAHEGSPPEETFEPGGEPDTDSSEEGVGRNLLYDPRMPSRIEISDALVVLEDVIQWNLDRPAHTWRLTGGGLTVQHRPARGEFGIEGSFDASALPGSKEKDETSNRGTATWDLEANYRDPAVTGTLDVRSLDLSWMARMGGRPLADRLKGGELDVSLKNRRKEGQQSFTGQIAMKGLHLDLQSVAETPIRDLSAAYSFAGTFDPDVTPPEPTLFPASELVESSNSEKTKEAAAAAKPRKSDSAKTPDAGSDPSIPETGVLRIHEGKANFNGVKAQIRPSLFGIDGLGRRPGRLDLDIELPETDVQTLFDAVPAAIRGPLNGTSMRGTFEWTFHGEFPLHNAGETEWTSKPTLRGFALTELPEAVDVRRLTGSFVHTIAGPQESFRRTIRIPAMRPVPKDWMTRHVGAEAEELEERRQRRGWPGTAGGGAERPRLWSAPGSAALPVPQPWTDRQPLSSTDKLDVPEGTSRLEWGRRLADQRLAPDGDAQLRGFPDKDGSDSSDGLPVETTSPTLRPWDASVLVESRRRSKLHRYGPYVYTPLQHISPWLPRAIRTTEDNSFFEHHGFNWFALKASLEDNLEAGGFVRGGSTISMQLVKNLFLAFDKVLARKLREAFLVWLMEDIVDVPKARILELYFNVIEFGPGIYGIHDAAAHYFGKRPDELTLGEVSWLVSIIPNPREYHRYYRYGELSPGWVATVVRYAEIMADRDRAGTHDAKRVESNPPTFYKPGPDTPVLRPTITPPILPGDDPPPSPVDTKEPTPNLDP
jgi:hypothetical protein